MKVLIAANWKCNPVNLKQAKDLFKAIKKSLKRKSNKVEVVICPPFVYLSKLKTKNSQIKLGAQNCFWKKEGAFTGEVSPLMLNGLGVDYIILGHSERRKYFKETNHQINKKIKLSLKSNLKPILCLGETEEERENNKKGKVIENQLKEGLKGISSRKITKISVAYEPVWAIGSDRNCSVEETMSSILLIRKIISKLYSRKKADKSKILYGGSVDSQNAVDYIKEAQADGLLIGGASLKAKEFNKIIRLVQNS